VPFFEGVRVLTYFDDLEPHHKALTCQGGRSSGRCEAESRASPYSAPWKEAKDIDLRFTEHPGYFGKRKTIWYRHGPIAAPVESLRRLVACG
jgi:hypothetical protein